MTTFLYNVEAIKIQQKAILTYFETTRPRVFDSLATEYLAGAWPKAFEPLAEVGAIFFQWPLQPDD